MKKIIILIALIAMACGSLLAQDDSTKTKENTNKSLLGNFILQGIKPITGTYESGILIDNQTNIMPSAKSFEFVIQHRFGNMTNGIEDLYGIYGAANTRLAFNYTITDWLQLGYGISKLNMISDLSLKVNIAKQSRTGNKMPVDITYYGNWSIDGRDASYFGNDYNFNDRSGLFNEFLFSRKFTPWLSISAGASFTHFNTVDTSSQHDKYALHFLGRGKITPQGSIIVNCDVPLKATGFVENQEAADPSEINFGIGYEIATATHAFQIFMGSGEFLVPQYNVMWNQNNAFAGDENFWSNVFIGFNITRVWNF